MLSELNQLSASLHATYVIDFANEYVNVGGGGFPWNQLLALWGVVLKNKTILCPQNQNQWHQPLDSAPWEMKHLICNRWID